MNDDLGMLNDDFGYASSNNDYYPIDITQGWFWIFLYLTTNYFIIKANIILGDNYGNSVKYQTFGRIDDSADEWIDDGFDDFELSTRSIGSKSYGSRDRTFDFLDEEDDDDDIFTEALDVRKSWNKNSLNDAILSCSPMLHKWLTTKRKQSMNSIMKLHSTWQISISTKMKLIPNGKMNLNRIESYFWMI